MACELELNKAVTKHSNIWLIYPSGDSGGGKAGDVPDPSEGSFGDCSRTRTSNYEKVEARTAPSSSPEEETDSRGSRG